VRESFGKRLRRLRVERGLSQRDLSGPGISYAYISRLEADARRASLSAVRKLAAQLAVTPLFLELGTDNAKCPHCGRR
jgi:transcriptional regulator with XRE-family HTH domain